ncbi:M23 family metallopeptidase [Massilia sp.]|uniref:M23 family metallopeptidase n=1 Tax=Massilia sp. TaxID=1882437 RepID=UPI00289C48DA|nr:M23 family metallopeptidase [Massilia sp.]
MKKLMIFVVGLLVGAGVLFVLLGRVPDDAPPPEIITADTPATPGVPAYAIDGQLPPAPVVEPDLSDAELPLRPDAPAGGAIASTTAPSSATPAGKLLVPVQGIKAAQLSDTFDQARGEQRRHEALDIMAPQGTPVIAAADGKVVKLFQSKPGGLTVYQFDPTEQYAYYYAHLDRYAEGVTEGKELKRGDLVGYVGVTGNSDPNAPHLHFALVQLTPEKQWWKGTPINPYPLMTD